VEISSAIAAGLLHCENGSCHRCNSPAIHCISFPYVLSLSTTTLRANHETGNLDQLSWIGTAFTLTDTAFVPIFGQLADISGRYAALQIAVVTMTLGGVLCASAPAWPVLVLVRAIQGVGKAGMSTCSLVILAEKVSLTEQAFNTSIFHFLIGIAYATGPLVRSPAADRIFTHEGIRSGAT
jgi:MFS family permease